MKNTPILGEIRLKLTDKITKLNSQDKKKISSLFHTSTSHIKCWGLVGRWDTGVGWRSLRESDGYGENSRLWSQEDWVPNLDSATQNMCLLSLSLLTWKTIIITLTFRVIGGLELIGYVKCLEHSRCSIIFSSYGGYHFDIFACRYN